MHADTALAVATIIVFVLFLLSLAVEAECLGLDGCPAIQCTTSWECGPDCFCAPDTEGWGWCVRRGAS